MTQKISIPKIIWQTHHTELPPLPLCNLINNWVDSNPEYRWCYMNEAQSSEFILDHFSDEFFQMYNSISNKTIKSDVWKIAILYIYGGVYCDINTVCLKPIDTWIGNKRLIINYDSNTLNKICIASVPQHPALFSCLNQLITNYKNPSIQNFVEYSLNFGIQKYFNFDLLDVDYATKIFTDGENAFTRTPTENSLIHIVG